MENDVLCDINIIRTRWNKNDPWRYEICSNAELENYENTKDAYTMCVDRGDGAYQRLNAAELEIVYAGEIYLSDSVREVLGGSD